MTRRRPGSDDLPIVIKEAGKAVERDIKPTLNLLGRFFLGDAMPPLRPEPVQRDTEDEESKAARLPPSNQIIISQVRPADEDRNSPHIIEAEIIEETTFRGNGIPRICPTCGGAGRLGKAGYEVPCPSCNWPKDGRR